MNKCVLFLVLAVMTGCGLRSGNIIRTETVEGLRIELHIVPAEPFYTPEEAAAGAVREGMLVQSGAAPLQPHTEPGPARHLIVHVYDARNGAALTDAQVSISYQPVDGEGRPAGKIAEVPIVVMQIIGHGAQSTHYGNNVAMPAGSYIVTAIANGRKAEFRVKVSDKAEGTVNGIRR